MVKHLYCSFGGGIQSTAIALLIHHEPDRIVEAVGALPKAHIFADTGAEMIGVIEHIKHLGKIGVFDRSVLRVVHNGSLLSKKHRNWSPRSFIPLFTRDTSGKVGMLRRKCTNEFKIKPIEKAIRGDIGLKKYQNGTARSVGLMLGISTDEAQRMRDNRTKLFKNLYPLIELGWDRAQCREYCIEKLGYEPLKSRCFMCPYISDWDSIRRNQSKEFDRAVKFDEEIRDITNRKGKDGIKSETYVHRNCRPLAEAVVNQGDLFLGFPDDDFQSECSGHCGI